MFSFKPAFSLSSFTFIESLFSFSSLSASRVVSPAYLRLLLFLLAIMIPTCDSSSLAFCTMNSAFKLNKQSDNIQLWHTPFPVLNQFVAPCPVLTVASWPSCRFPRRQARWSDIPIYLRIFQFVVIHTVKNFSVVSEAEVDVFLESPCFLYDPMDFGNLISGPSDFSKSSLYIWKFLVRMLLKPSLKDFEHYLTSMRNEYNCTVVWTLFGSVFLWDWNENTFSSPGATAEISKSADILSAAL